MVIKYQIQRSSLNLQFFSDHSEVSRYWKSYQSWPSWFYWLLLLFWLHFLHLLPWAILISTAVSSSQNSGAILCHFHYLSLAFGFGKLDLRLTLCGWHPNLITKLDAFTWVSIFCLPTACQTSLPFCLIIISNWKS